MPDPRGHRWTVFGAEANAGNVRDAQSDLSEILLGIDETGDLAAMFRARAKGAATDVARKHWNSMADRLDAACHDELEAAESLLRAELERLPDEIAEA